MCRARLALHAEGAPVRSAMSRSLSPRELPGWLEAHPGTIALAFFWLAAIWAALLAAQGRPLRELDPDGIRAITRSPAPAAEETPSVLDTASCAEATKLLSEVRKHPRDRKPATVVEFVNAAKGCCLTEVMVRQLDLDFAFPLFYVGALSFAIVWRRRQLAAQPPRDRPWVEWLRRLGALAIVAALVAGAADWLEGLTLLHQIDPAHGIAFPGWTHWYSRVKWGGIDFAVVYLLLCWITVKAGRGWRR